MEVTCRSNSRNATSSTAPTKKAKKDIPQEVESFDYNVDGMLFRIRSFAKITNTCPSHGKKHKLSVDSPDSQEAEKKKKKTKKLSHIPSIPKTKRKDTTPNFQVYMALGYSILSSIHISKQY